MSDTPLKQIRELANELGVPIQIHLHETADEIANALAASGKQPWQRLRELELAIRN